MFVNVMGEEIFKISKQSNFLVVPNMLNSEADIIMSSEVERIE